MLSYCSSDAASDCFAVVLLLLLLVRMAQTMTPTSPIIVTRYGGDLSLALPVSIRVVRRPRSTCCTIFAILPEVFSMRRSIVAITVLLYYCCYYSCPFVYPSPLTPF